MCVYFIKQKTAYEMRISDWSSDVCSSDLAVFGVTFFGSGSEFRTQYEELDRIFGVTKAEQHVLADLLGGHDADHISKMRQISVETVRSHIRAIYSKVGVRSREALFHKLQPFRDRKSTRLNSSH